MVVLGDLEDEDLGGAEGVEGRTGVDMRQGRERRKKKFGCFGQMLLPTAKERKEFFFCGLFILRKPDSYLFFLVCTPSRCVPQI